MKNHTSIYRTKLLAKLHIIITQQGVDKEALYSSFGVESATQMSDAELIECVNLLEGNDPYSAMISYGEREMRQKRSQILSVLTKSPNPKAIKNRGLGVPNDWAILNPFIEKLSGKRLTKMTMVEMDHFKLQLFKMRDKGWVWSDKMNDRLTAQASPSAPTFEPQSTPAPAQNTPPREIDPNYDLYLSISKLPS